MHLWNYIKNNFRQKKTRSNLSILGMTFSIMMIVVVSLIANRYVTITHTFFTPFGQFDEIVERGTNFFEIVPTDSLLDQTDVLRIESFFNTPVYPSLFIQNDDELGDMQWIFLMGIPTEFVSKIWEEVGLQKGNWEANGTQVIVGSAYRDKTTMEIVNQTFTISGVLNSMDTYLDKVIIFELATLQQLWGLTNKVTLFFVPRTENSAQNASNLMQFESLYPELDYLTEDNLGEINHDLTQFSDQLSIIFTMIASVSALIFVFTLETLNIINHKEDIILLQTLGASKKKIIQLFWSSTFLIILIGFILGVPISIFIYLLFVSYTDWLFGSIDFISAFINEIPKSFSPLLLTNVSRTLVLIILGGLIFSLGPILLTLKRIKLNSVKVRY